MEALTNCCTIKIARFEHYPTEEPNSFCVGFTVTCNRNGKSVYRDTIIPYSSTDADSTDDKVTQLAWTALGANILAWFDEISKKSSLVGATFTPV